jgi:hypothetical protein
LGAEGREFESLRPDHSSILVPLEDHIEGFLHTCVAHTGSTERFEHILRTP